MAEERGRIRGDDMLPPPSNFTASGSPSSTFFPWIAGPARQDARLSKAFEEMINFELSFSRCIVWTTKLRNKQALFHIEKILVGTLIAAELFVLAFMRKSKHCLFVIFSLWFIVFAFLGICFMIKGPLRYFEHFFCVLIDTQGREHGIEVS